MTCLLDIPSDILSIITRYLQGKDTAHLFLCGNQQLNTRFIHGGITEFYHHVHKDEPCPEQGYPWPQLMHRFIKLRHISIVAMTHKVKHPLLMNVDRPTLLSLFSLPNVTHLNLDCRFNEYTFPHIESFPPHLVHLSLRQRIEDDWIEKLPTSLTSLEIGLDVLVSDVGIASLPESLTALSFHPAYRFTPNCLQLQLLGGFGHDHSAKGYTEAMYGCLPKNLTCLRLFGNQQLTTAAIESLPKQLTTLEVYDYFYFYNNDIRFLPQGLTSLRMDRSRLTDACIPWLPPSLKRLHCPSIKNLNDDSVQLLPKGLTDLKIPWGCNLTDKSIQALPQTLVHLHLKNIDFSDQRTARLPQGLQSLHLTLNDKLTDKFVASLPCGLNHLDLLRGDHLTSTYIRFLPRHLTCLNFFTDTPITDECISDLPSTLIEADCDIHMDWQKYQQFHGHSHHQVCQHDDLK